MANLGWSSIGSYGSFFGSSQLSIAQRILECKRFLDVHQQSSPAGEPRLVNPPAVPTKEMIKTVDVPKDHEFKASRDYSFVQSCNAEVMPKLVESDDGQNPSSSRSLIATKRKSEEKINCVEPRKTKVMQNEQHPSLKVQATDHVRKTSLSKPQNFERLVEVHHQSSSAAALRPVNPTEAASKAKIKIVGRPKSQELKASRDYSSLLSCNADVMPKVVKSDDWQNAPSSGSLIAKNRKSEEKIDCMEPKKAMAMQNKQQSSFQVQATDHVRKTSLSKPQSVAKKANGASREFHPLPQKAIKAPLSKLQSRTKQHLKGQQKKLKRANKAKSFARHETYSDEEVDMSYISSLCQKIFRRNHTKRVHDDNDLNDECMVSSFSDILKEEKQSEKLARKEEQMEQLRLERKERERRLRRQAKKLKLSQH